MRTVVIGAGFAGLSTARHLAKKGVSVTILERDDAPGRHASGKNAGMIRQAVSDPHMARLAREGRDSLAACRKEGWPDIGFRENGSLFLSSTPEASRELRAIQKTLRGLSVPVEKWTAAKAKSAVEALHGASFDEALFCAGDAIVDTGALLEGFLRDAARLGVEIVYRSPIRAIRKSVTGWSVVSEKKTFEADAVVNAAGAWASLIGRLAHASAVPLKAYRRHLYQSSVRTWRAGEWPFVWDLSREIYFRPIDSQTILLSPCDKTPSSLTPKKSATAESVDPAMEKLFSKRLAADFPSLAEIRLDGARAALRTMVPDGRFVIGEDPVKKGFFWVAGLGGHGVTTAFSSGRLAADLVLGHNKEVSLAAALSPERFSKKG